MELFLVYAGIVVAFLAIVATLRCRRRTLRLGAVLFTSQVLTDRIRIYDLVKYEVETRITRTSGKGKNIHANTIAAGSVQVGHPMKLNGTQWEFLVAGDEANCKGLWLGDPATVPFNESLAQNGITAQPGQILFSGPAVIDKDKIALKDLATSPGTFNQATILTQLAALNIRTHAEPATNMQQTT